MKNYYFLLFLCLISILSCDNEPVFTTNNQNPTIFSQNFGSEINRPFFGEIVDINNLPLSDVVITIGNQSTLTDNNGIFIINDALVNERFGYVKASKSGYIHASRAVVPNEGTNKIRIMMLPETITGITSSGTEATINLPNGASVELQGDYINENGITYEGNVNVIIHFLDPTDDDMEYQMPGMLYAANAQNEERFLNSFGMLAVELRGENGEDLNLAENSFAEITLPLDESLIASAPSSIPLWYFDEANGYWVEEGEATLSGNTYVGSVSHFSFWNCDIPMDPAFLCFIVENETGNRVANLDIQLRSNNLNQTTSGITNSLGMVSGIVPRNEILDIEIYGNGNCLGTLVYDSTTGPFENGHTEETIVIDSDLSTFETVSGQVVNCNSELIHNGYVIIDSNGFNVIEVLDEGLFSTTITRCLTTQSFNIFGVDIEENLQSAQETFSFESPVTDVGNIVVCSDLDEYITYTIDGVEEFLYTQEINAELCYNMVGGTFPTDTYLFGIDAYFGNGLEENCFRLIGILNDEFSELENTYDYWYFEDETDLIGLTFNGIECGFIMTPDNTAEFNITNMGEEIGDFIDMYFSLDYFDQNGQLHTMQGEVHVRRDACI